MKRFAAQVADRPNRGQFSHIWLEVLRTLFTDAIEEVIDGMDPRTLVRSWQLVTKYLLEHRFPTSAGL